VELGEIIMSNWDLGEFHVKFNVPFSIRQVQGPICRVIAPIPRFPNPITKAVTQISLICSYPPPGSHLQPPSLAVSSTTIIVKHKFKRSYSLCLLPDREMNPSRRIHHLQHTPFTAYSVYGTHRLQHTLSTAYTEYRIQ
jgi:hypothetical protein